MNDRSLNMRTWLQPVDSVERTPVVPDGTKELLNLCAYGLRGSNDGTCAGTVSCRCCAACGGCAGGGGSSPPGCPPACAARQLNIITLSVSQHCIAAISARPACFDGCNSSVFCSGASVFAAPAAAIAVRRAATAAAAAAPGALGFHVAPPLDDASNAAGASTP